MSHPFTGTAVLPFDRVSNPQPPFERENVHKALAELPEPQKSHKGYYASAPAAFEMDNPKEDLRTFLRSYFYLKSADWKGNDPKPLKAWEAIELAKLPYYYVMPFKSSMREVVTISMADEDMADVTQLTARWLDDKDLGVYVQDFGRNGFQGGLN